MSAMLSTSAMLSESAGPSERVGPGEPAEAAVLFENVDWTVTAEGIDHRRAGYGLPLSALDERRPDGLWAWPVHLMDKSWCEPQLFAEAFFAALRVAGLAPDARLAASFRHPDGGALLGLVGSGRPARSPYRDLVRLGDIAARVAPVDREPLRRAG